MAFSSAEIFESLLEDASSSHVTAYQHAMEMRGGYRVITRKGREEAQDRKLYLYAYVRREEYRVKVRAAYRAKVGTTRTYQCRACWGRGHNKRTCEAQA